HRTLRSCPRTRRGEAKASLWRSGERAPSLSSLHFALGPRFRGDERHRVSRSGGHLSRSATFLMPASTQASSFSPPGAPEAPIAPMTSSPTLIGSAPRPVVKPVRYCAPICGFFFSRSSISPDGMRKVRDVNAFLKLFSRVCGPVLSPRNWINGSPLRPTTVTDTAYPLVLQTAIVSCAIVTAMAADRSLRLSSCACAVDTRTQASPTPASRYSTADMDHSS